MPFAFFSVKIIPHVPIVQQYAEEICKANFFELKNILQGR